MDPDYWHCIPPTTSDLIPWQPAPNFRSTINILTSCVTTLFICVWSALHVDIATGRSTTGRHLSKLGWVFVGLFCPELLFYIAFQQFKVALILMIKAHEYLPVTAQSVKGGEVAQCPELPRSYRVLATVLGLTGEITPTLLPRDDEMSEDREKRDVTPTELSPLLESSEGTSSVPDSLDADRESSPLVPRLPPLAGALSPVSPHERTPAPEIPQPSPQVPRASVPVPHAEPPNGRNTPASRKHRWTLTHGFYAAMGGFVLKDPYVPPSDDHYLPAWQANGVLTPSGVLLLMKLEPSLIPDLAYDDIIDRGKADVLGKALLVLQVSWFLITCIIRHAQGLPLCLLEITTIAHAACTVLTYFLWWHKPKDVEHQTAIDGPVARPLGAWMSKASSACRYLLGGFVEIGLASEVLFNRVKDRNHLSFDLPGKTLKVGFIFDRTAVPWYYQVPIHESPDEEKRRKVRWVLACEASEKYRVRWPEVERVKSVVPTASLQAYTMEGTYDVAASPWTHFFVVTILMGAVYGLPHLVGFTVTFASATERTLWLVATVLVATMGMELCATMWLLGAFFTLCDSWRKDSTRYLYQQWWLPARDVLEFVISILYICSSGYLVVESIRQLFALPPRAFDLPSWGRYWPHFS